MANMRNRKIALMIPAFILFASLLFGILLLFRNLYGGDKYHGCGSRRSDGIRQRSESRKDRGRIFRARRCGDHRYGRQ